MTRDEAKRYWTARYEAARNWDDPHWEASERKDHRRYVDALKAAIDALSERAGEWEESRKRLMEFVRTFENPSLDALAIEALSDPKWNESVKAEICDDICRYPHQFNEDEQAELDAICAKCPLERV